MKKYSFFKLNFILVAMVTLLLALGCSTTDPVSPGKDKEENQTVKSVSTSGVSIYNNVASFKQNSDLIQGPDAIVDLEIPEVKNPKTAFNFARSVQRKAFSQQNLDFKTLDKLQGSKDETVIWDVTFRDEAEGVTIRSSLIYNDETGIGRLFVVGFDYIESRPLEYDSTEIVVDLNKTLLDESDDVLISLINLKRYKPGRLIQEEFGRFEPDPYEPGTEPVGGKLSSDITYSSSSFISRTEAEFEYHEGFGGRFFKESTFSDGKKHTVEVTFNVDGTGTLSESRRDGTSIEGTFDSAEEDGKGSYSLTTTFPDGHDPVAISESGDFTIDGPDSIINGSFEKKITYLDGRTEVEKVSVSQSVTGNIKTTTLKVENPDGSHGEITIEETPDVNQVSGKWTDVDETFLIFNAEYYPDGSAHFKFDLYESEAAYDNGDAPIASGEFDFYPDGSGQGTVKEGDQSYDVTVNPDGSVVITPSA
ncbi:MAG: hypothetical protein ACE5HS_05430 [bacterium]